MNPEPRNTAQDCPAALLCSNAAASAPRGVIAPGMLAAVALRLGLFLALPLAVSAADDFEFFEKRVRPVLVERCYECHGEKKQKGGLRLDSASAIRQGGDSGAALVPGKPEQSRIVQAIAWSDPDLQMPPKNKLNDAEIAALTEWIQRGAPDPRTNAVASAAAAVIGTNHWAYQPVRAVIPPTPADSTWPKNNVDRFILARLEAKGIAPAPEADRDTLLRRASFDLIGLPPSPEEAAAFRTDASPQAFERVVDRLLASPQFGERWGRHWLDVVRYGESVTLRGFVFKEAWRYRDYVIDAFNEDRRYDEFLREQIAGDLLSSSNVAERRRRIIATTFLALGNTNLEEQDKAQLRMDIVDEQLDTIGKAFLAQTIGCARCHDHKFDPIPTRDYYALAGILRNTKTVTNANVSGWIESALPSEPREEEMYRRQEAELASLQAEIKVAKNSAKALAGKSADPGSHREFKPSIVAVTELPGIVVDSAQAKAVGDWKHSQYSKHFVGDGYLHDDARGKGQKTLTFIPDLRKAGRYEVRFSYQHSPSRSTNVAVTVFHADGETTIHVDQQEAPVVDGRFVVLGQFRFEGNGFGYALVSNEGTIGHVTADAVQFLPVEMVEAAPRTSRGGDSAAKLQGKAKPVADADQKLKALEKRLKELQASGPKRPMVMGVREEKEIGDTYIHVRGSVHNRGPIVPRGFLQAATLSAPPAVPSNESGRRQFADWIVDPANPLTSRVMVNRVWHWLFGAGLVRTTDNFGTTGEAPSHPELLDYLAGRFVAEGWSVKKLVREIMLSRTYQLGSRLEGDALARGAANDPENRLLGRANRRRLDAECLRDAMLLVSGELKDERGGPGFPATIAADYGFKPLDPRRSVYLPVFRNALPEIFEAFDFADPSMVTGARTASTVAPQALFLMNHPFVREQARAAARRFLAAQASDESRFELACRWALGRSPTPGESALARKVLEGSADRETAWTDLFHGLFACPDFRYVN